MTTVIPMNYLERRIYLIRGHKVMLDQDLASLYGVPTKRLNEQVKRNLKRFPKDFMFRLKETEIDFLRSQNATLNNGLISQIAISSSNLKSQFATSSWGGRRKPLHAFTEQGVAMLSSVLNSERAIEVNIAIMRAFVRLREMMATHKKLAVKLAELEKHVGSHDQQIKSIFEAIYELTQPEKIGFRS